MAENDLLTTLAAQLQQPQPSPMMPSGDGQASLPQIATQQAATTGMPPSMANQKTRGMLKQMLTRFAYGMGQGMTKAAGLPTDQEVANDIAQRQLAAAQAQHAQAAANLAGIQAQSAQAGMQPIGKNDLGLPETLPVSMMPQIYRGAGAAQINANSKDAIAAQQAELKRQADNLNSQMGAAKLGMKWQAGDDGQLKLVPAAADEMAPAVANQRVKEAQGQQNIDNKLLEFRQTDDYRRWKDQQDNATKVGIARLNASTRMATTGANQDKAPAAVMQTAIFSKGGLERLQDADSAMSRLQAKGVLGSSVAQNKVEDWIFGKGMVDPSLDPQTRQDIGKVRAALGYTSSAAMRAHTGRTSQEIYNDFKARLGANQDWSALKGAMDETKSMLTDYALSASDASIRSLRNGTLLQGGNGTGGRDLGAAPAGRPEGSTGTLPDGTKVVIRGGRLVTQ